MTDYDQATLEEHKIEIAEQTERFKTALEICKTATIEREREIEDIIDECETHYEKVELIMALPEDFKNHFIAKTWLPAVEYYKYDRAKNYVEAGEVFGK